MGSALRARSLNASGMKALKRASTIAGRFRGAPAAAAPPPGGGGGGGGWRRGETIGCPAMTLSRIAGVISTLCAVREPSVTVGSPVLINASSTLAPHFLPYLLTKSGRILS